MSKARLRKVCEAIEREQHWQRRKWGDKPRTVQAWLLVTRAELEEAITGWVKTGDDAEALTELVQVAACCISCLQEHGIHERPEVKP